MEREAGGKYFSFRFSIIVLGRDVGDFEFWCVGVGEGCVCMGKGKLFLLYLIFCT